MEDVVIACILHQLQVSCMQPRQTMQNCALALTMYCYGLAGATSAIDILWLDGSLLQN